MQLNKRIQYLNAFGLLIILLLQVLDNVLRELSHSNKIVSLIKNGALVVIIFFYIGEIIQLKLAKKKTIFKFELKKIIWLAVVFSILSIYYIIQNKGFNMVTVTGIAKILLPVIIAYAVLNVMDLKYIYNVMVIFLMISFFGYVYSVVLPNFTLGVISQIDILDSYSPFESNFFSPVAIACCIFFGYYRNNKFWLVLSTLFSIMTNKRIMILYAVFLLFFGGIFKTKKEISKSFIRIFQVGFCLLFFVYFDFMLGKYDDILYRVIGMNANKFTMGRGWLLENLLYNDFRSIGFYSSTIDFRSMEMDFPMIYVEMGIIAVIFAIFLITKIARRNWYNFVIIAFILLELLTSHWFDVVYFWIIAYITIGCISYKGDFDMVKVRRTVVVEKYNYKGYK